MSDSSSCWRPRGSTGYFQEEGERIRDVRRVPLRYADYSISYRRGERTRTGEPDARWHAHVEIERRHYRQLLDYFLELASHRSVEKLALAFYELPHEPYAPIRRQLLTLLRAVNRVRKAAGFSPVPVEVLPLRRRVVKPFRCARSDAAAGIHRESQPDSDRQAGAETTPAAQE